MLVIFVIYIYIPTSFAITRVMRSEIYPSLTIMVLAGAIGWLGSLQQNHKENKNINLGSRLDYVSNKWMGFFRRSI
ncbi:MAG: hypothetical protein ACFBSE_14565 [Prochloraceae cyanobacterium]